MRQSRDSPLAGTEIDIYHDETDGGQHETSVTAFGRYDFSPHDLDDDFGLENESPLHHSPSAADPDAEDGHDEKNPLTFDHDENKPLRFDHDENKPLRFDHDDNKPLRFDHDVPIKSVETEPIFKVSHSYDRSFSTTTAIHLDDHIGDLSDEDELDDRGNIHDDHDFGVAHGATSRNTFLRSRDAHDRDDDTIGATSRHVSESFSAMPEEMDFGGSWDAHDASRGIRTPQSAKRHSRTQTAIWTSSGSPHKHENVGSRHGSTGPRHPQSNSGAARHSTPFRNPSSVRAIQMSSPSPPQQGFAHSPRSARLRRELNARSGTPSTRTDRLTSQQSLMSTTNKEYPLVLLHCSISPAALTYSTPTLQKVLPAMLQENLAILREKIGPTVLERGILIPHPGDDYELLEERVLENLDLKMPRVTKSGHFNGGDDDYDANVPSRDPQHEQVTETCAVCNSRGSVDNSCSHKADPLHRKWDIRVYAANGLMRAGAWTAAWREMEKVDIELGIWIAEDLRRELEREKEAEYLEEMRQLKATHYDEANQELQQAHGESDYYPEERYDEPHHDHTASAPRQGSPDIRRRRWADHPVADMTATVQMGPNEEMRSGRGRAREASDETVFRVGSAIPIHSRNASIAASSAPISAAARAASGSSEKSRNSTSLHRGRQPLSTLLLNYISRTLSNRPDIILQFCLLVVGIVYLTRSATSTPSSAVGSLEWYEMHRAEALDKLQEQMAGNAVVRTVTQTQMQSETAMCMFPPGQEDVSESQSLAPKETASAATSSASTSASSSPSSSPWPDPASADLKLSTGNKDAQPSSTGLDTGKGKGESELRSSASALPSVKAGISSVGARSETGVSAGAAAASTSSAAGFKGLKGEL